MTSPLKLIEQAGLKIVYPKRDASWPARWPFQWGPDAPWMIDLFCCQGGASAGYNAAGFNILGVDLDPQSRYPFPFVQADAIEFAWRFACHFAAAAASPPCQRYTLAQRIQNNDHPDLIKPTREALLTSGRPYVIENVPGARDELLNPVELCGTMFGLRTYRHRLFEPSPGLTLTPPAHPSHEVPLRKMGRALQPGDYYHAVGNFSGVSTIRRDMGVFWMSRDGIRECIPPDYAHHLGRQLIAAL